MTDMSIKDIQERTGYSYTTIYSAIRSGRLKASLGRVNGRHPGYRVALPDYHKWRKTVPAQIRSTKSEARDLLDRLIADLRLAPADVPEIVQRARGEKAPHVRTLANACDALGYDLIASPRDAGSGRKPRKLGDHG